MKSAQLLYTLHLAQQLFERFVFEIQYNTAIPSIAAIERFFSTGNDILKPKRNSFRRPFSKAFAFERQFRVKVFQTCRLFFFASPSVDKVVTVRESFKTWVKFLTACQWRSHGGVGGLHSFR